MSKHKFKKEEIKVNDAFIEKFSSMYIKQRTESKFDYKAFDSSILFKKHGFSGENLQKIITKKSVAKDILREDNRTPSVLNDIYRSDLGELLLTYYFEERLSKEDRFKIPFKNISNRELAAQPGRGLDAVGYRVVEAKVNLLLGEGKVSHQKKNPPDVVDYTKDSIYETQKKFKENKEELISKLSDLCRKLPTEDAEKIGVVIVLMSFDKNDDYDIVFGCSLLRDKSCVKVNDDYGKLYTQATDFDPYQVSFCLLSLDDTIENTVTKFYTKVQEMCNATEEE